ncbi:MAG: glycosyltransferase [Opitutales bacterium]|nr:glycosyltransferase [Opitutales bacterium]
MKIFITAHSSRRGGGVVVAQSLLSALARMAPGYEYVVTIPPEMGYEAICTNFPRCKTIVYKTTSAFRSLLWHIFSLRNLVKSEAPDVLLNLGNWAWFKTACTQETYIQWPYICYPSWHWGQRSFFSLQKRRFEVRLCRLLNRLFSDRLYCQTSVMKARLERVFGCMPVRILPTGIALKRDSDHPRKQSNRGGFTLFYPALSYPHKNIDFLLRTFVRYKSDLHGVRLLLTINPEEDKSMLWAKGWGGENGLEQQIVFIGERSKDEIEKLYDEVDALVFPSLLETLGIPLLEAMGHGLPILASDLDFARGNCGDAALYFNPTSEESLKDSIVKLKNSPELYEELSANALRRICETNVSWDDIAKELVANWRR